MRLLLVNYEYPPVGAGAGTATRALAKEFTLLGHQLVVLTGRFDGLPRLADEDGVAIHRIPSFRKVIDRCSIAEMISFLAGGMICLPRIIRRYRIEAAMIFFSFPCGPIGLLGRWLCGVPYVVSLRGGDVPGAEPHLRRIHGLLTPIRRLVLENALATVANSDGLRKMAEAADPYRVRVIPNGVDAAYFQPAASPSDRRPFRLLFAGRFQTQKNLPFLFEQLAQLPSGTFELHLVGDGPLKADLHERAKELGIETAITWHGWLTREKLRAVYQSADCLVNPSNYEGMPNVVLEAMACGLPVIASRVAGNDTLVTEGGTGYLFELEDPATLLSAIQKLMKNRALCAELGSNGRARAECEFSWRSAAQAYLAILQGGGGLSSQSGSKPPRPSAEKHSH